MSEEKTTEGRPYDARIAAVRDALCGYQLCIDMLKLRRYERKRAYHFDEEANCEELLSGSEALWRARMYELEALVNSMKNGREKIILYYHYIRGESIERAADLLGVSRRTGYRLHQKGLLIASFLWEKRKNMISDC